MPSRRLWYLAAVAPVAYALVWLAFRGSGWAFLLGLAMKSVAILGLLFLLCLCAELVAERPGRWRHLAVAWIASGVVLVGVVGRFGAWVAESFSGAVGERLWPGSPAAKRVAGGLDVDLSSGWTAESIVRREVIATALIAAASAGVLRLLAPRSTSLAVFATCASLWTGLGVYMSTVAPYAWMYDFDPFIGDAVLGSTYVELFILPVPADPIVAAGLGGAAIVMAALIQAWGGPVAIRPRTLRELVRRAVLAGDVG